MSVSREVAIEELKLTRRWLDQWIEELENPTHDGEVVPQDQIPEHVSIGDMGTIPREQLKSELAMMAGKLEVLATTV